MNKAISIVALLVAVAALILAAHAELTATARAERAVQERETELIDAMWPTMRRFYADTAMELPRYLESKPQRLEDMFRPLFNMMVSLQ